MELIAPALLGLAVVVVLVAVHLYRKSRPRPGEHVFVASRWSPGNRLFPTQVAVTPTSVIHYTPHWVGRHEHSINIAHVASVRIDTKLLFADVFIETTGGQSAIQCRGHHKGDALQIKQLIEQFQTAYYRTTQSTAQPGTGPQQGGE
jgi:hypothetical protein